MAKKSAVDLDQLRRARDESGRLLRLAHETASEALLVEQQARRHHDDLWLAWWDALPPRVQTRELSLLEKVFGRSGEAG